MRADFSKFSDVRGAISRRAGFWSKLVVAALAFQAVATAQTPRGPKPSPFPDSVSWSVSVSGNESINPGASVKLLVQGAVLDGWHVYALKQKPRGPIALSVDLEPNDIAAADGAPLGSQPVKAHDSSFGFETQYYDKDFTLTVPVRLKAELAAGEKRVPVSVQFQSCNGKICQPPKTVHLTALISIKVG